MQEGICESLAFPGNCSSSCSCGIGFHVARALRAKCTENTRYRRIVYNWKTTGTPSHYKNVLVKKLHILLHIRQHVL